MMMMVVVVVVGVMMVMMMVIPSAHARPGACPNARPDAGPDAWPDARSDAWPARGDLPAENEVRAGKIAQVFSRQQQKGTLYRWQCPFRLAWDPNCMPLVQGSVA